MVSKFTNITVAAISLLTTIGLSSVAAASSSDDRDCRDRFVIDSSIKDPMPVCEAELPSHEVLTIVAAEMPEASIRNTIDHLRNYIFMFESMGSYSGIHIGDEEGVSGIFDIKEIEDIADGLEYAIYRDPQKEYKTLQMAGLIPGGDINPLTPPPEGQKYHDIDYSAFINSDGKSRTPSPPKARMGTDEYLIELHKILAENEPWNAERAKIEWNLMHFDPSDFEPMVQVEQTEGSDQEPEFVRGTAIFEYLGIESRAESMVFNEFFTAMFRKESTSDPTIKNRGRFIGLGQFGEGALVSVDLYDGDEAITDNRYDDDEWSEFASLLGVDSIKDYKHNWVVQRLGGEQLARQNWKYLESNGANERRMGKDICLRNDCVKMDPSGLIAGSHLGGAPRVAKLVRGGRSNPPDARGTRPLDYIRKLSDYPTPFDKDFDPETFLADAQSEGFVEIEVSPTTEIQTK